MKVTLTIPDTLADVYEARGGTSEMVKTLTRFAEIPSAERCLTVWGADRLALEKIMQTTVESPKRLLDFMRNMGSVKIGPVERVFSPSELIRLGDQATFHGWTPEQYVKMTADEAINYLMDRC